MITLLEDVLLHRNYSNYLVDPLRLNLHFNVSRDAAWPAAAAAASLSGRQVSNSIDMDDFLCEEGERDDTR